MQVQILGSAVGVGSSHQYMMSYLINGTVAIDAGCIGLLTPVERQEEIQHVFISHTHIDHIGSLPTLVDNTYKPTPDCVCVWGGAEVLECLRKDIFNDRVWPDMITMSETMPPFLELRELTAGQPVEVCGLRITPLKLDHVTPTMGFVVEDENTAVGFVSDTGPTQAVWDHLNQVENLHAVFLEASFPNSMQWLADASQHLTPKQFGEEAAKLHRDVDWIAVHLKPSHTQTLIDELSALELPRLRVGLPGNLYTFRR